MSHTVNLTLAVWLRRVRDVDTASTLSFTRRFVLFVSSLGVRTMSMNDFPAVSVTKPSVPREYNGPGPSNRVLRTRIKKNAAGKHRATTKPMKSVK